MKSYSEVFKVSSTQMYVVGSNQQKDFLKIGDVRDEAPNHSTWYIASLRKTPILGPWTVLCVQAGLCPDTFLFISVLGHPALHSRPGSKASSFTKSFLFLRINFSLPHVPSLLRQSPCSTCEKLQFVSILIPVTRQTIVFLREVIVFSSGNSASAPLAHVTLVLCIIFFKLQFPPLQNLLSLADCCED